MGTVIGITGIILSVLLMVLFLIGFWKSKNHSFKEGAYFFLLLIIHEIYLYISPSLIQSFIEKIINKNKDLVLGLSIGELVVILSFIPKMILLAAFIFLVYGLRRMWHSKNTPPPE